MFIVVTGWTLHVEPSEVAPVTAVEPWRPTNTQLVAERHEMLATALTLAGRDVASCHVLPPSVLTASGADAPGPGPLAIQEPSDEQSIALSV